MPVTVSNPAQGSLQRIMVYDIRVEGEEMNLSTSEIRKVEVLNNENSHEYALITTQLTKKQIGAFVNKRISFSYGRRTNSTTFYGYVVAVNPSRDYQLDTIVDISCIGVTWPMQSGTPRFVQNSTVSSMFASIVTSHGLGAQVYEHPTSWPALSQTEESDWQMLINLANKVGFAVYNYKGIVRLVDPMRVLQEDPVFQQFIKGDDVLDKSRELLDWSPLTQSMELRENIQPAFGFFEGAAPAVSQDRLVRPFRLMTDVPVKNKTMAETYVKAWNHRAEFWNQQATARIQGNSQVVPGINVSVQTTVRTTQPNEYDGVWLVRGVKHALTHNSFQTQLDLSRETKDLTTKVNPNFSWFWNTRRGIPSIVEDTATNRWRSSWGPVPDVIK